MSGFGSTKVRRLITRVGLTLALVALGQLVLIPSKASAATNLTVSTVADIAANAGACGNTGITTPPAPLSLREATCLANNIGGAVNINVPAGTYNLANGELAPGIAAGANVSLIGAGAASTIVNAGGNSRVFDLDKNLVGGVSNSISGMTITGGADSTFGGAGIIGGSNNNTTADTLSLNNVIVTGNAANGANMTVTNKPGGGIQFLGGQLTISNSTISNNTSGSSYGSGLAYGANGEASPEGLTITNTTFSGNSTVNSKNDPGTQDGGALALFGTATSNFSVAGSRFVNNTSTSTGSGPAVGGAIWEKSGNLTVTGTNFTGNSVSGGTGTNVGGAVEVTSGNSTLHYDRLVGNIAPAGGGVVHNGGTTDATENWWGCNTGPGTAGCDTVAGGPTVSPRLVLTASASPATVVSPNGTSTISAALTTDSLGAAQGGVNLGAFGALPVTFSDPPGDATVTLTAGPHTAGFSAGVASIDYHSGSSTLGPDPDNITFDNATVSTTITVNQAPAITSANTAHFNIGQAGSFTVTTTGFPNPTITETGTLPTGLSFTDNGDGTATLSGTPSGGGGTFPLTVTANNGVSPNATQTLTVTVGQPPAFTSGNTATFTVGTAGSFTVTTSGVPTVSTITEAGTLPSGLTFTDNGNGTAVLAGTPAAGSGGTYPVTLTATNGVSPNATQNLTIQVNQAPAITTNPSSQTVNPGTSVSFTAAATGVPTPAVQWQRSTNGGTSYANIPGATSTTYTFTTVAGDNGNLYHAVFTNVVGTATTSAATLNVGTAPSFTSPNTATFTVGTNTTFNITTTGVPNASLSKSGAQFPASWLTFTDGGNGQGTLVGTPPAGAGGTYTFQLFAANGFSPSATQIFTLVVNEAPTITSTNHATFTVGSAGSFAVTTSPGYPTATGITETGTLPSGVTLTDNNDGTATLAGTPAAGTSGSYPITIRANATGGTTAARTQSFVLTVNGPPVITSTDHATFAVGAAGSFTVTTTAGFPAATTLTKTGTLPAGVTFTDNGDGTATLAGTPAFGTGGVYSISLKASNGIAPDATQTFTLTVNQPPVITSTNHATFTVGTAAAFTVTTSPGQPAATTITETGALPAGVTFTDNGDGTATLGGTPTSGGTFTLTIKASNGVAPDASQTFTLTVNQPPTITSTNHATFTVGAAGSFTVTTTAGTPAARTLTETGALPSGVTFTDNGNGTATLAGTPAAGTGNSFPLTIRASNGVAPVPTQAFTLTVLEPTTITSVNHATFLFNTAGSFTVTTAGGFPTPPVLSETGATPAGITFTDNGDGTATLAGTPTAGGSFPLTLTANNGVAPNATQAFTLRVDQSPSITSTDHATFTAGTLGSFTVTTTAGTPPDTTVSETGTLPAGVTFVDNGDGTATLAGTPAAGTGGSYPLTIKASNGVLPDATQSFTLTVDEATTITSADHAAFRLGAASSFTVTTGHSFPTPPTLAETGALPTGITFVDNGDGTATLAGTPTANGIFPQTITAANGTAPDATQAFTLTVNSTPSITSADNTTFAVGTLGTFTVTTTAGTPAATTLTEDGDLPSGVTFTDNGDGTATLTGTPAVGTGGAYPLTITASNGIVPDSTQSFTLTVTELPAITSPGSATFTAGTAGSFTVTTTAGFPTATTLTEAGALPSGLTFTDNGDGTATLGGTPAALSGGAYPLILTATNAAGHTDQLFTVTVNESSAISSADHTTFVANTAGSFTVTTAGGFPTPPTLTSTGALPAGVTFADNGDGTATLAGTATSGGTYALTFTASNGASVDAVQHFVLTVDGPPSITSSAVMTFTAGVPGSFTVTTRAGVPAATTVTSTGALPAGITFADNGDGTATLAGTTTKTGTFHLTFTASNGIAPDATQAFSLKVEATPTVVLSGVLPASAGTLQGVPPHTHVGQILHLRGTNFAAGAPVTIGIYSTPTVLGHARAGADGTFTATITVPNKLGNHTFVAAGIDSTGDQQYLEARSLITKAVTGGGTGTGGGGTTTGGGGTTTGGGSGSLPFTGTDARATAGWAFGAVLFGLVLMVAARRRRKGNVES